MRIVARLLVLLPLLWVELSASATSYSTTYVGTIGTDDDRFSRERFPNIVEGESYAVTLVMNNGNASAASQAWSADDVECLIFRFNDARDVVYAEDISSTNPYVSGSVVTNETGTLTAFFDQIVNDRDAGTPLENYSTRGFSEPPLAVNWYLIGQNNIFSPRSNCPQTSEIL